MCILYYLYQGFPLGEDDVGTFLNNMSMRADKLDTAVSSSVSMEMTLQSSEQQKSNFSFLSPADLLKTPPSKKIAHSESASPLSQTCVPSCSESMSHSVSLLPNATDQLELTCELPEYRRIMQKSTLSDPNCLDLNCVESLSHSTSPPPNVTDQLELTCELTEGKVDKLQTSRLSLYNPNQVDLKFAESLSHSTSFVDSVTDKLDLTCCISKQTEHVFSPLSQDRENENEDKFQCLNTLPSINNGQMCFPDEEKTKQVFLISSAGNTLSPNRFDLTCAKSEVGEEKQDSGTPFVSSSSNTTDVQEKLSQFTEISTESEDCGIWLDSDVGTDTFLLEEHLSPQPPANLNSEDDPSVVPVSSPSATSTASLMSTQKSSPIKSFNVSGLQRLVKGKGEVYMETPVIETPEAVPIERGFPSRLEGSTYAPKCFVASDCLDGVYNVSAVQDKSVLPSPSAYSKFCGILNCDQTVVDHSYCSVPCSPANTTRDKEAEQEVLDRTCFSDYLEHIQARYVHVSTITCS